MFTDSSGRCYYLSPHRKFFYVRFTCCRNVFSKIFCIPISSRIVTIVVISYLSSYLASKTNNVYFPLLSFQPSPVSNFKGYSEFRFYTISYFWFILLLIPAFLTSAICLCYISAHFIGFQIKKHSERETENISCVDSNIYRMRAVQTIFLFFTGQKSLFFNQRGSI